MPDIKIFADGSKLEYGAGRFDDWCVYLTRPGIPKFAPKDISYFKRLKQLSLIHGAGTIYEDFVTVYEKTDSEINPDVLELISKLSGKYGSDSLVMDILLTILYAGMVAEERKAFAVLKKRIKRLGMYQVLVEGISPHIAAHFSRGKKWKVLDVECKQRGF